jgi:pre-mRNA-splicing factor CWC22
LILELTENMGLDNLNNKFKDEESKEFFDGLFPKEHPKDTKFAINFFTSIGVGALSQELREHMDK